MVVDAFASLPHYFSHIAPIWKALPTHLRGTFYISTSLLNDAITHRINVHQGRPRGAGPIIVAGYTDYRQTNPRPVVFVEHGSGQTYATSPTNPAYSGGTGRDRVVLFVCPNQTVADRNLARYPTAVAAVVGCPRLDQHVPRGPRGEQAPLGAPLVAITFHADIAIAPESRSAYRTFHSAVHVLRTAGYNVLGHGHPRIYRRLVNYYVANQVPHTPDSDWVLRTASVLVCDNSSLAFEAAYLGIPIVWMSPHYYRRDVHQPPRFWDALILGPDTTHPSELPDAVTAALQPVSQSASQSRDNFLRTIYSGPKDGRAAERAADAIVALMGA